MSPLQRFSKFLFFLFLFGFTAQVSWLRAQQKLLFKKEGSLVFFQKGLASDTIKPGQGDLFYLLVPDALKERLIIRTTNGHFEGTENDSLLRFRYIAGIDYEHFYTVPGEAGSQGSELRPAANGAGSGPRQQISIRLLLRGEEKPLMENHFYYGQ